MKLTFDEKSMENFLSKLNAKNTPTKILFDFDDGVGPLSKYGSCSLNVHFRFVLVDDSLDLKDYDKTLETNVGSMKYKGYSEMYIQGENLRIEYNPSYGTNVLKTDNETVDPNCEIVDFREIPIDGFR